MTNESRPWTFWDWVGHALFVWLPLSVALGLLLLVTLMVIGVHIKANKDIEERKTWKRHH